VRGTSIARRCAGLTFLYLGGGLGLSFPVMLLVTTVVPDFTERVGRPLFYVVMALLCGAGGLLWGAHLARLARAPRRGAWALGGALGYGLSAPLAMFGASQAETFLLDRAQQGVTYPMHVAFALIFACVLLLVVGLTALGVGLAAGNARRALGLAGRAAGTAVGAFLAVDLAFDLAGWRVGAPGAEARATMLVVLGAGLVVATLAGGGALGRRLVRPLPDEERGGAAEALRGVSAS
jgi:hypothetical protein